MDQASEEPARRADARRNIERIITAAIECLGSDPQASLGDIARAAGVGRVTVYAHFRSREALIEAAVTRSLDDGERLLRSLDLDGPPLDALRLLITASWELTARTGALVEAAQASLPPGRLHELHAPAEQRVSALIERGQSEGVIRDDLPSRWLASTIHHLIKGAAADVAAGRLDRADVGLLIAEVVVGGFRPPPP